MPADFWCQHAPSAEHHWDEAREGIDGKVDRAVQETLVVACTELDFFGPEWDTLYA